MGWFGIIVKMFIDDKDIRKFTKSSEINLTKYGRKITKEFADNVILQLRENSSVSTGNLRREGTIYRRSVRGGWGQDILMPEYGIYLDEGAKPARAPMPNDKARQYMRIYGVKNRWAWKKSIMEHGTKPHPFIEKSFNNTNRYFDSVIIPKYMEKIIR